MTWVKLGDEISQAAEPLSDAAFRTHIEALAWSARHLLDLQVPFRHLHRFAYCADPDVAAKELVEAGWWEERGDGWYVGLQYPEWQLTRIEVEQERIKGLERQHRRRRHVAGDHSTCLSTSCPQAPGVESTASRRDKRRESRRPDPSRPVPEVQGRDVGTLSLSRRDSRLKKPTPASVTTHIEQIGQAARAGLRDRAVEALLACDGLPYGWERDRTQWEPLIYGRMKKLTYEEQLAEWEADKAGQRRTGT